MQHRSIVRVVRVERGIRREEGEPRDRVVFSLESEGLPEMHMAIWVHPDWPRDQQEAVARTILRRRLEDLAEAAGIGALDDEADAKELWRQLREEERHDDRDEAGRRAARRAQEQRAPAHRARGDRGGS